MDEGQTKFAELTQTLAPPEQPKVTETPPVVSKPKRKAVKTIVAK
jgi:hypothetical protein